MSTPSLSVSEGIATITFNRPKSLNAITVDDYKYLAETLRSIDTRKDVIVTVVQATGSWFCAGTDVSRKSSKATHSLRDNFLTMVGTSNTDCSQALYTHSKLLVAALNGPVMGIAAAFLGHFDFIYCMPNAWLSTPFTFLGIISEAGSSVSFVNRLGLSKANEVLILGKKLTSDELLSTGFVNKIFPQQDYDSFHRAVRSYMLEQLEGLDPTSVLMSKQLIQYGINEKNSKDATNLRESYAQAQRFTSGVPAERFSKIARKELKHKL